MFDEKKPKQTEVNFLPPLDMVLTFFDRILEKRELMTKPNTDQKETEEKNVEKLIGKLSEKDE